MRVVNDKEAESAAMVVCADADFPSPFTDNVHTICHFCAKPIIHRPTAPKAPIKACMECALSSVEADGGKPDITISERDLADLKRGLN